MVESFPQTELSKAYSEEGEVRCGALGLVWNLDHDTIQFDVRIPVKDFTPRGVLSINHAVWDPLGLLSPLLIQGRILQRKMFQAREGKPKGVAVQWDAPLNYEFYQEWCDFLTAISHLETISFPRAYFTNSVLL